MCLPELIESLSLHKGMLCAALGPRLTVCLWRRIAHFIKFVKDSFQMRSIINLTDNVSNGFTLQSRVSPKASQRSELSHTCSPPSVWAVSSVKTDNGLERRNSSLKPFLSKEVQQMLVEVDSEEFITSGFKRKWHLRICRHNNYFHLLLPPPSSF